ncbi:RNA polymerase III subunit GL b [Morone saxatilis]|uniref:RNA polymerase III subunit GL b n=1 Tax=Morone saxatilis TaxID=34816 RepID=UPI0015E206FD|nr:RNA polymerase III subunit GL b [Morone saxatilis]
MTGRGRGRGRRMMTFSVEAVGINRGDSLPPSIQQPTPLFPVMEQKPLPLAGGEEAEYLLALKQEFRGAMKSLPCFIQPAAAHRDVERYSDKYHSTEPPDGPTDWTTDWKRFPKELRVHIKKRTRDGVSAAVTRSDRVQSGQKKKKIKEKEEVLLKLETLEKKEERDAHECVETDYVMSYFDNGEEFGGDSDDNMDEAIY